MLCFEQEMIILHRAITNLFQQLLASLKPLFHCGCWKKLSWLSCRGDIPRSFQHSLCIILSDVPGSLTTHWPSWITCDYFSFHANISFGILEVQEHPGHSPSLIEEVLYQLIVILINNLLIPSCFPVLKISESVCFHVAQIYNFF